MKVKFCSKCHRKLEIPKFLQQGNIKVQSHINLECGYCKHKNKYKPEVKEQITKENIKEYWAENSGLSVDEINDSLKEEIKTEEVSG